MREHFLLDPDITFLNHGSFGACPKPVMAELQRWQLEMERNPVQFLGRRSGTLLVQARQALAARVDGDAAGLETSRLPALETALGEELLPQRSAVLEIAVRDAAQAIERQVARRIADQRRQLAEQTLELRQGRILWPVEFKGPGGMAQPCCSAGIGFGHDPEQPGLRRHQCRGDCPVG